MRFFERTKRWRWLNVVRPASPAKASEGEYVEVKLWEFDLSEKPCSKKPWWDLIEGPDPATLLIRTITCTTKAIWLFCISSTYLSIWPFPQPLKASNLGSARLSRLLLKYLDSIKRRHCCAQRENVVTSSQTWDLNKLAMLQVFHGQSLLLNWCGWWDDLALWQSVCRLCLGSMVRLYSLNAL